MELIIILLLFAGIAAVRLYLRSPAVKGRRSEQAAARLFDLDSRWNHGGKTLTNLYVPKPSGDTAEIDVLYITCKGLLVLESKNYAGYIFGSESNRNWTVTLYAGKDVFGGSRVNKYRFYNPIWQNRTHIRCLKEYLGTDVPAFSLIAFSGRGELKDIDVHSPDVFVCNHALLFKALDEIWNENPDVLTDAEIEEIYDRLLPLTSADKAVRQKHAADIRSRFSSTETCPVCGGQLVIRTAKRGANAGNRFYGCSNYPKCRYTRNL